MRRLVCVIGALAVTAGAAGASTVGSGLRGVVYSSGGGACLDDGNSCSKRPVAGMALMFSLPGRASVKTTTNDAGAFRVGLAPGMWTVRLAGPGLTRPVSPGREQVTRGRFRMVTLLVAGPKIP